jgi:two-component system, OmpR family, sensor histidine kinase BaeS
MSRLGLGAQIALAVVAVALLVGLVLAIGTLVLGGRSFSELMVEHGESVANAEAMFRESVVVFFVAALVVAAAASTALAVVVGRRVAAPLRDISDAARDLAQGNYGVRVGDRGPAEVRSLAESFNWMAREIEEQERMRREFVANAAHELRTPLTNLQGYLEALRDGVVSGERSTFESLHEEVDRLVRMSRSLDTLAEGAVPAAANGEQREIDLRAAILAAVEVHAAAFEKRRLAVEVRLPDTLAAHADADHIAQVLANLLQNAVRYTPEGGRVSIAATVRRDDVLVSISNSGPGIPPGDLAHVFERFYRVEKSRDRAGGGAGIGLAIVKTLVELGGGAVGVESAGGTTRFWFSLPQ